MAKKLAKRILWLVVLAAVAVLAVTSLREGLHRLDLVRYPLKYSEYVEAAAAENEVDPLLIYAVILIVMMIFNQSAQVVAWRHQVWEKLSATGPFQKLARAKKQTKGEA